MAYHKRKIKKGKLGEFSKIIEEIEELFDAKNQNNNIMIILELSDLYGAIELYLKKFNLTMEDLKKMSVTTASAFIDGTRK